MVIILITLTLILLFTLVAGAIFYGSLIKKLDHVSKAQEYIKKRTNLNATRLVHQAHKQALTLIENANREAQEILGKAKFVDEESKALFQKKLAEVFENQVTSLRQISKELINSYQSAIAKLGSQEAVELKDISEKLKEEGMREIEAFKGTLEHETIASQKVVEQKIAQDYDRVREEIEAYRQEMLKKVDNQIYEILQTVSKQVLGKALTLSEQEELVLQALNEAKRQGVLNNGK